MFHVIRRDELPRSPNRTVQFEGEPYRAGISFFLVDNEPGEGPELHLHPCIHAAGRMVTEWLADEDVS